MAGTNKKILDLTGTEYLWNKIKTALNSKADASDLETLATSVPTATTSKSGTTTTLTVTDKNGTTTSQILDGVNGDPGVYIGDDEPTGDETIWIDTSGGSDAYSAGIEYLETNLNKVKNLEGSVVFETTYVGTRYGYITVDIPAGAYILDIDNITSGDTDTDICTLAFDYVGTEFGTLLLRLGRNHSVHKKIVLEHDVDAIHLYAASNYANSADDIFSFAGFKLTEGYPLRTELIEIEKTVNEIVGNSVIWKNGERTYLQNTLAWSSDNFQIETKPLTGYSTYIYDINDKTRFKVTGKTLGRDHYLVFGTNDEGVIIQKLEHAQTSTVTQYTNYEFVINDPDITKVYIVLYESATDDVKIGVTQNTNELSILFVGNSLTQDGIAYLPYLLTKYYPEVRFRFYIWYNGGYSLAQQYTKFTEDTACQIFSVAENTSTWTNSTAKMSDILSTYNFNIVCMQEYFYHKTSYTETDLVDWTNCRDYITSHYTGGNSLEFISLFHSPATTGDEQAEYDLIKLGNALILKNTLADDMIPNGIALHMARDTALDELGDQGHLTPDNIHAQEGLPCLLEAYTALLWIFDRLGINKSIYGLPFKMTSNIYGEIAVPGANPGSGVIEGTDAQNLLAQEVAVMAYKAGKKFVTENMLGSGGGGTSDYEDLTNKPQINNITLIGNKSLSNLDIASEAAFNQIKNLENNIIFTSENTQTGLDYIQVPGYRFFTFSNNIPAGTYTFVLDEITSDDTDADLCVLSFVWDGGQKLLNLERDHRIVREITFDGDVTGMHMYASIAYSQSNGDTAYYKGFRLIKKSALEKKLEKLESDTDTFKEFVLDEIIANKKIQLIPNIPDPLPALSTGAAGYYVSNRIIPKGSLIKSFKLHTKVDNTGSVLFINNDDIIVYKYIVPCVADQWNTFNINLFTTEDLRMVVNARCSYTTANVTADIAFHTDGLWATTQYNTEVGDTLVYSKGSPYNFMICAQLEVETSDKFSKSVVAVKDERPASGYHNFSVSVNYHNYVDNTTDGETFYTDYGVVALPTNYSATGTPTKLIILCGGSGERIGVSTDPSSFHGWAYYLAKGYAVMDMNGVAPAWGTAMEFPLTNWHYCNKYLIDSYHKGYEYVLDKFNIDKTKVFIAGISMGGGASALLVQSGLFPVVAHCAFCPALSVYKQHYMGAWSGDQQRKTIAGQYGFADWDDENTTFDQAYFLANMDKVVGFDNLAIHTFGDMSVANTHYGDAEEAAAYNSLQKYYPVPLKIWHCENDTTVLFRYSQFMVNMIRNAGGQAWLRSFETGAHIGGWGTGSVTDTDINGNEITTSIPFYESVLFFKRFG